MLKNFWRNLKLWVATIMGMHSVVGVGSQMIDKRVKELHVLTEAVLQRKRDAVVALTAKEAEVRGAIDSLAEEGEKVRRTLKVLKEVVSHA